MTLKVLYTARAPFISGAERALLSMLRHRPRPRPRPRNGRGGDVEVRLVLGHDTKLVTLARQIDVPVDIAAFPKRSKFGFFVWRRSVRRLERIIREFQPDILHANDVPSAQAMSVLGARLGIPRVVHVRWGITGRDLAWWARAGAEHIICISQWVKDQLGDRSDTPLARSAIDILPDAVDWPAAQGTPAPGQSEILNLQSEITLGFAGQLIPAKGLDLVIEALGLLPPPARPRLLIAGEDTQAQGAYKAQLQALAQTRGVADRIEWLGFLPHVSDLYKQVDVVVCPSRVEPLGLVPLEAAEFSRPALASRIGGLAETIVDGQTGWLVEPTPAAWAQALTQLTDRPALARLGANAHARAAEIYTPGVYWDKLLDIYNAAARSDV